VAVDWGIIDAVGCGMAVVVDSGMVAVVGMDTMVAVAIGVAAVGSEIGMLLTGVPAPIDVIIPVG